jgi:O-antigen ligase
MLQPKYLNQAPLFKTWPAKIVAAIGAMALASAVLGISLGASASFILSDFSKTLLLSFLLVAATRNAGDVRAFSWAFVLGCAFLVYLSLFFFQLSKVGGGLARLNNLYMYDANDINSILVIGFGLVALLAQTYTGARRFGCIILMLGMGAAISRSGSRDFPGLLVVGAGLLITLNRVSVVKRLGFVGLIGLGLALYAPPGYWNQMKTILAPKQDYNWSAEDGRRQIWTRGMGYMMQYPIGGLGIGNFQRAECTISSKAKNHVINTGLTCIAPHNSYLQIGAELGFPGLTLWLVMIFGGIANLRALAKRVPRHWEKGDADAQFLFQAPRYLTICRADRLTSFFVSHAYLDPVYILMGLMAGTYTATRRSGRLWCLVML